MNKEELESMRKHILSCRQEDLLRAIAEILLDIAADMESLKSDVDRIAWPG